MLTIVDKRFFYKESAKTLELIIKTPLHCNNVNDAIAVLFDDMNYEFTGKLIVNSMLSNIFSLQ